MTGGTPICSNLLFLGASDFKKVDKVILLLRDWMEECGARVLDAMLLLSLALAVGGQQPY